MPLIRDRRIVADDFVTLADDAEPTPGTDVIVSWARWQRDRDRLAAHDGRLGVRVPSEARIDEIAADAPRFAVIAIEFPKFTDGRGYTMARRLRERYGFRGEIRAVGEVLRDQLMFMARCGFDAFELREGKDPEQALSAFDEIDVRYQSAVDEKLPIWRRQARSVP